VIQQGYPDQLAGLDQPLGDGDILLTGLGVAARVIVHRDDARGRVDDSRPEDLARMNDRGVEATDRDRLLPDHFVPSVQEQHQEMLALFLPEPRPDEGDHIVRPTDLLRLLAAVLPLRQFADVHANDSMQGREERRAPSANAWSPDG